MAICPAGHQTSQSDFCDICGLPVPAQASASVTPPASTEAPVPAQPVVCPNCQTPNVADALFCEACGYDFTTGSLPEATPGPVRTQVESPLPESPAPAGTTPAEAAAAGGPAGEPGTAGDQVGEEPQPQPEGPVTPDTPAAPEAGEAHPSPAADPVLEAPVLPAPPVARQRPVVEWVAELWIDPDWYTAQGSSDPMPSPSLPDIVPLVKEANLIGRVSHSRGIFPDVDCDLDTGCSRRHAMLTTDGSRWWIEDLDSANGTFVGAVSGPLPAMPIPRGRVEVNPGQRIYVGAWTRIVIRRATEDEKEAFA